MNSDTDDIQRAVNAGLPAASALLLAALRQRSWRSREQETNTTSVPEACWPDIERALQHPAAAAFDELFVTAMRREHDMSCRTTALRSQP